MKFSRISIIPVLLLCAAAGCSGKKDFSKEQLLLNSWSAALKNRDYSAYTRLEAHPRSADQFLEMYKDYFPGDPIVMSVTKPSEEKSDVDDKRYISRTVDFGLDIVMRKDGTKIPSQGSVVLVQYRNQSGTWLVADKTIIRSK
jgi:HJR/Mrr/RecB family endonuclease